VAIVLLVGAAGTAAAQTGCEAHAPIEITEEEGPNGFVLLTLPVLDQPVYRPGNGVRAGDGSAENPYVIEGFCISSDGSSADAGIRIANTDSHVLIRDNQVDGFPAGIAIADAGNVAIVDNAVSGNVDGVLLESVRQVAVEENAIEDNGDRFSGDGIVVEGSEDVAVRGNTILGSADDGVEADVVEGLEVTGNEVAGSGFDGVDVDEVTGGLVAENHLRDNDFTGIYAHDGTDVTLQDNVIEDNGDEGIKLRESKSPAVLSNTVDGNEREGLKAFRAEDVTVAGNAITANGDGIDLSETTGAVLEGNDLTGNDVGLDVRDDADTVEATGNWWGEASGPGGEAVGCSGTVADGAGEPIDAPDEVVCFDPWRDEPNPDAGASIAG
jgi:parallel beta-helix repeat protein